MLDEIVFAYLSISGFITAKCHTCCVCVGVGCHIPVNARGSFCSIATHVCVGGGSLVCVLF